MTGPPAGAGEEPAVPKLDLILEPAREPIREPVTKFGGQPVWLGEPTWPVEPTTGRPMEFVAQVRLEPELFATTAETLAYLFVADAVYAETYDPYSGQSAVLLQPGGLSPVPTVCRAEGPTLHHLVGEQGNDDLPRPTDPARCEFAVLTVPGTDPAVVTKGRRQRWSADPWLAYVEMTKGALGSPKGHKVGGKPYFFRGWPAPFTPDAWRLVLQLDGDLPFILNLGPDGIGYVLVTTDLRSGVFFWERPG